MTNEQAMHMLKAKLECLRGLKWNDECVIAWMPLPEPWREENR